MIKNWFTRTKGRRIVQVIGRWILLLSLVPAVSLNGQAQDASVSLPGHARDAQEIQKSCRNFVQSFYDWYVKRAEFPRALKYRPSAFSPELFRRLREDHEAQVKAPGDIAGLDFDPFLNSQDPGDDYVVGRIKLKDKNTCWAEIHTGSSDKMSKETYVAAELVSNVGRWQFVNFQYSNPNSDFSASVSSGGLLGLLKDLREDRKKAAKAPSSPEPTPPQTKVPSEKHPKPVSKPTLPNWF